MKGHIPEKDGILACLLMAELVATERKTLGAILKGLEAKTGAFFTDRLNLSFTPEAKTAILQKLAVGPAQIGKFKVEKFITTDGFKVLLGGGQWVAFRASGTEPLIRCYIEAKTEAGLKALRGACQAFVKS